MRIVVTGLIAAYPLGGVAWDYLQYVRGLRALGHDVLYLEDTGRWPYAPWRGAFTDECSRHVAYLRRVLDDETPWAFRDPHGDMHGRDDVDVRRWCAEADLLLNVSGACWLRDEYRGRGPAVWIDTDPGYTQATLLAAAAPGAPEAVAYAAALIRSHDVFVTCAERIGMPGCTVPTAGLDWKRTRHPIVLDDWPWREPSREGAFTTVMSWQTNEPAPVLDGHRHGGKGVELRKLATLPRRTSAPLELAISGDAPRAELEAAGWRVVDAQAVSSTPEVYRDYLRASCGEIGVTKEVYVATRSGWFSSRSASYLALGRPVVVQDTGLAEHHPIGRGLLVFDDVDGAAAALAAIAAAPREHAEAARAVAAESFDARRVLPRLLEAAFS